MKGREKRTTEERRRRFTLRSLAFLGILCAVLSGAGMNARAAARVMEDGTVFDPVWYAAQYKDAAAAGGNDAVKLYRYYQLYGQGLGEKPYDTATAGQTALSRLERSGDRIRQSKAASYGSYGAAWETVTTRVYDTDTVKVWHSEYLVSDRTNQKLRQVLSEFEENGYAVGFVLADLKTGDAVSYHAGDEIYSASVIKAPYLFSVLEGGNKPTQDMYLAGNQSDNDAYRRVRDQFGNEIFASWLSGTNVPAEQADARYVDTTPLDLCRMFYKGTNLLLGNEANSDWARDTFTGSLNSAVALTVGGSSNGDASQTAGNPDGKSAQGSGRFFRVSSSGAAGSAAGSSGNAKAVYSKAGWIASGTDNSYTNAAVVGGDYPYVVAVMSDSPGYKGLEYAKDLMPVLDQFHDEMVDPSRASGANVKAVEEFANSAVSSVAGNK